MTIAKNTITSMVGAAGEFKLCAKLVTGFLANRQLKTQHQLKNRRQRMRQQKMKKTFWRFTLFVCLMNLKRLQFKIVIKVIQKATHQCYHFLSELVSLFACFRFPVLSRITLSSNPLFPTLNVSLNSPVLFSSFQIKFFLFSCLLIFQDE